MESESTYSEPCDLLSGSYSDVSIRGERERLGVGVQLKSGGKNKRRSKGRQETDGTAASMYVLCHHIYTCPNLRGRQYLMNGIMREGRDTKFVRVCQSLSEVVG